ncbi:MAG TPA: HAD-IA family hydrolase [Candidatus Saccharimonadales bacterium]
MIKAIIFDFYGVVVAAGTKALNEPLLTYIKDELKPHYKIGLLSNADPDFLEHHLPAQYHDLFDNKTLSGAVGFSKPQREIFQVCLNELGVQPDEALFVDDWPEYIKAGEALGMHGVAYTTLIALQQDLAELLPPLDK